MGVRPVAKGNRLKGTTCYCITYREQVGIRSAPLRVLHRSPSPPTAKMLQPMSPVDLSAFSTPPTTPRPPEDHSLAQAQAQDGQQSQQSQPALKRRSSGMRPLSLTLSEEYRPPVVVENSPDTVKPSEHGPQLTIAGKILHSVAPHSALATSVGGAATQEQAALSAALKSPCFVHSGLDKGAALAQWLRSSKHITRSPNSAPPAPAQAQLPSHQSALSHNGSHKHAHPHMPHHADATASSSSSTSASTMPTDYEYDDEEDDSAGNLTRQLAETAVSVREMSKQLGTCMP